jgi:hypothetical protein
MSHRRLSVCELLGQPAQAQLDLTATNVASHDYEAAREVFRSDNSFCVFSKEVIDAIVSKVVSEQNRYSHVYLCNAGHDTADAVVDALSRAGSFSEKESTLVRCTVKGQTAVPEEIRQLQKDERLMAQRPDLVDRAVSLLGQSGAGERPREDETSQLIEKIQALELNASTCTMHKRTDVPDPGVGDKQPPCSPGSTHRGVCVDDGGDDDDDEGDDALSRKRVNRSAAFLTKVVSSVFHHKKFDSEFFLSWVTSDERGDINEVDSGERFFVVVPALCPCILEATPIRRLIALRANVTVMVVGDVHVVYGGIKSLFNRKLSASGKESGGTSTASGDVEAALVTGPIFPASLVTVSNCAAQALAATWGKPCTCAFYAEAQYFPDDDYLQKVHTATTETVETMISELMQIPPYVLTTSLSPYALGMIGYKHSVYGFHSFWAMAADIPIVFLRNNRDLIRSVCRDDLDKDVARIFSDSWMAFVTNVHVQEDEGAVTPAAIRLYREDHTDLSIAVRMVTASQYNGAPSFASIVDVCTVLYDAKHRRPEEFEALRARHRRYKFLAKKKYCMPLCIFSGLEINKGDSRNSNFFNDACADRWVALS